MSTTKEQPTLERIQACRVRKADQLKRAIEAGWLNEHSTNEVQ